MQYRDYSFTCPECGKHELHVQTVTYHVAPVQKIKWTGFSDDGVTRDPASAEITSWEEHYQCAGCGEIFFTLEELLNKGNLKLLK